MLEDVTAVRFIRVMGTGRTKPLLVETERSDGSPCEVVVKLSEGECGVSGLVREAISAMLAADLGLPMPEPVLVHFPVTFGATLTLQHAEVSLRIAGSVFPSFGTIFMKSLNTLMPGTAIPHKLLNTAAEIATFDGICRNPDRRAVKPNCLTDNDNTLFMIDHELALSSLDTAGSFIDPYPWQVGGMAHLLGGDNEHILFRLVKGKGANIDRLEAAWAGITPDRVAEYFSAVPSTWIKDRMVVETRNYVALTLNNLAGAFAEARRMIS